MALTSLVTRLRGWKAEAEAILRPCSSAPSEDTAAAWYAGLAVSPASFSRQLTEMESSLLRANESADEAAAGGVSAEAAAQLVGFR